MAPGSTTKICLEKLQRNFTAMILIIRRRAYRTSLKHPFPTKTTKILETVPTVATTETGHTKTNHLKEPMEVESRLTTPEKLCGDVMSVRIDDRDTSAFRK
ncbi:uncharacterized protein LOC112464151 [Temnothorax curvispinosus]|uniref:Uncharacterized protein LOC112464151 n=1 Tax=Temnothorax curvispinosus TaxID=300111 RepID=A0A6J1QWS2_9HYME|nr:uncharacterized protein LOC112464151 [Temnothorax curvispinosus]